MNSKFDMKFARKETGPPRIKSVQSLQEVMERFFSRHQGRGNFNIAHLWENWLMVMGEELAGVAQPLGVHGRSLIIGTEDSMLMHELSFMTPEILARVNAFMDEEYFSNVHLELMRGRQPVGPPPPSATPDREREKRSKPENLGNLLDKLSPDSPIGRAYRSYIKSFDD